MHWFTPAESLPDRDKEVIVAWFDRQVTYHNMLPKYPDWDKVTHWSYMPAHPQNTKELGTTPNTGSPKCEQCKRYDFAKKRHPMDCYACCHYYGSLFTLRAGA